MRRRPDISFLLQATLVPVALLSGVALSFLREDKAAIEREARDRAARIMPELAGVIGSRVSESTGSPRLHGVVAGGAIVSPREFPRLPAPASWPAKLTPRQRQLWFDVQRVLFQQKDHAAAADAFRTFVNSGVSGSARANGEYNLLLLAPAAERVKGVVDLVRRFPEAEAESGTPLADLALLSALRDGNSPKTLFPEIARRIAAYPSFLTAELVDAAERAAPGPESETLREAWQVQLRVRSLLRLFLKEAGRTEAWLESEGETFLALQGERGEVAFVPENEVEQAFRAAFPAGSPGIPDYAGGSVELAGKRIELSGGDNRPALELATITGRLDSHPFTLRLHLAEPELLYTPYRRRQWMTAALVVSAAAAAMVGLASLWRGFQRQLLLGEMKSNFVSSVSHELRAPIAAVQLMAESLDRGKIADPAKQHHYFRLIAQECRRLSALVENVLDLSRIEKGRKEYQFEAVDPAALIAQAVAVMEPCAAERQISLRVTDSPVALPQPLWDAQAVSQSLVNLLDNAIKHAPAGSDVFVDLELCEAVLRLSVRDSGPGIPAADQQRIFDMFYRRGSELRRETKGAGIGLSIVKHVAQAHRGRVLVESAIGQGSRFTLELPIGRPA